MSQERLIIVVVQNAGKCSESSLDLKRFGLVLLSCLNLHSVLNDERIAKPAQNASNNTGALNTAKASLFIFLLQDKLK